MDISVLPEIFILGILTLIILVFTAKGKVFFEQYILNPLKKILKGNYKLLTPEETGNHSYNRTASASHPPFLMLNEPVLIYEGSSLSFTNDEYLHVLNKRNLFFNRLSFDNQYKFIERLDEFIKHKKFIIHDTKGYKEMPILISGAAIQLTFGLKEYVLPCFTEIHIYPGAFIGLNPLRVLIGNVSGHTITISWKHFLMGAEIHDDNNNVGLHEMAHALYYQNMVDKLNTDEYFTHTFPHFNKVFDEAFVPVKSIGGLYSEQASKNFQEFWAESIEIFFENPLQLQTHYPKLFNAICKVLNQNPLQASGPALS